MEDKPLIITIAIVGVLLILAFIGMSVLAFYDAGSSNYKNSDRSGYVNVYNVDKGSSYSNNQQSYQQQPQQYDQQSQQQVNTANVQYTQPYGYANGQNTRTVVVNTYTTPIYAPYPRYYGYGYNYYPRYRFYSPYYYPRYRYPYHNFPKYRPYYWY